MSKNPLLSILRLETNSTYKSQNWPAGVVSSKTKKGFFKSFYQKTHQLHAYYLENGLI